MQFKIDQLRKDKMIYGIEATAALLFVLVVNMFLSNLGLKSIPGLALASTVLNWVSLGALIYFFYMVVGNFLRLNKIKQLERKLYD